MNRPRTPSQIHRAVSERLRERAKEAEKRISEAEDKAEALRVENERLKRQNADMAHDREAVICSIGKDAWDRVTRRGKR